jgi:hypothetical protein
VTSLTVLLASCCNLDLAVRSELQVKESIIL